MRKKLNAGAIYDRMVKEGGPQTMSREDFVAECGRLTCPHCKVQDLTKMTMERGRQRTLGLYQKNKIDNAVKGR